VTSAISVHPDHESVVAKYCRSACSKLESELGESREAASLPGRPTLHPVALLRPVGDEGPCGLERSLEASR